MATWVINIMYSAGYLGVGVLMFLEHFFPPLPAEVIMPLAGFMVRQGELTFVGIVIAGTAGSLAGALVQYYIGMLVGEVRLKELADRYGRWLTVSRRDIDRAKKWFDKHGGLAVFVCRLMPGLHAFISIPAGIDRMNLASFLLHTIAGAALWTSMLAYAGHLLGGNYLMVGKYLDPAAWIVLGIILVVYIVRVLRHEGVEKQTNV